MPLCRVCNGTFNREQFIHGVGPRAQVCVRCGVEKGMVTKEEAASLYGEDLSAARLSTVSRRWGPLITISIGWILWITFLAGNPPWSLYVLGLLGLGTLLTPVVMIAYGPKFRSDLDRLTPAYDRPKGH